PARCRTVPKGTLETNSRGASLKLTVVRKNWAGHTDCLITLSQLDEVQHGGRRQVSELNAHSTLSSQINLIGRQNSDEELRASSSTKWFAE
ncbi:MAG: hypothetical protein ABL888_23110, partial [Pirellulaceae bacterium]